jgi:hypothetical protein
MDYRRVKVGVKPSIFRIMLADFTDGFFNKNTTIEDEPPTPRRELVTLLTSPRSTMQSIKDAILGQNSRDLSWNEIGFLMHFWHEAYTKNSLSNDVVNKDYVHEFLDIIQELLVENDRIGLEFDGAYHAREKLSIDEGESWESGIRRAKQRLGKEPSSSQAEYVVRPLKTLSTHLAHMPDDVLKAVFTTDRLTRLLPVAIVGSGCKADIPKCDDMPVKLPGDTGINVIFLGDPTKMAFEGTRHVCPVSEQSAISLFKATMDGSIEALLGGESGYTHQLLRWGLAICKHKDDEVIIHFETDYRLFLSISETRALVHELKTLGESTLKQFFHNYRFARGDI